MFESKVSVLMNAVFEQQKIVSSYGTISDENYQIF